MQPQKNNSCVPRDQIKMQNPALSFCFTADEKLAIMEALDHIHVTRQYQEMGLCSVCKKISIKKCSACGTFYCSSECQTYDWPKHKVVCSKQRDSASDRNSFSSCKQMPADPLKNANDENCLLTDNWSPFRALVNQVNKTSRKEFIGSESPANFKIGNKQYQKREQITKGSELGNTLKSGGKDYRKIHTLDRKKDVSPKKALTCKKSLIDEKRGNGFNKNVYKNNQNNGKVFRTGVENVPFAHRKSLSNLPKIGKMEVIGTYRHSADRYWVMDLKNLDKYEEIQNDLNKNIEKYGTVSPKVGLLCCCHFADEWFRGKIVSMIPDIIVHFIDFGNTSKYDYNIFKKLPDNLQLIPGLAFLIEFDVNTLNHYKTSDLDSVKFFIEETMKTSDGVPRVKVIEENTVVVNKKVTNLLERNKIDEVSSIRRSVMDTISIVSKGMIILIPGEGITRYGSIIPDDNKEANGCIEKVLNIDNSNASIEAQDGDYILVVDKEGNDQRGKVIMSHGSTYYVQLVDCGNVIATESVYPLPEDLKDLIEFGVKITVEEVVSESRLEKLETCSFTVTGEMKSGKWPCTLSDTECEVVAKVSLEKPVEKAEFKPKYVYLKSGSTVEISSSNPPNSFYVRPVDAETEQKFLDMNMEMIQYAPKAKNFAVPPLPGELCCAKFQEDDCFYRGIINSVVRKKANVLFVDFGNDQETDLNDVKPLSPSLKSFPFFAVKVKLKDVSRKPWNNMIKEYIGKLISENTELTLVFKDSIKNGVILREKVTGVVVNDFIEKARDKIKNSLSLKSESDLSTRTEIFLDDDMKYTTITSGTRCDLAILYVSDYEFETNYTFWATVAGVKNFDYVNLELNSLITEHCSHVSTPYKPSYRELCLAEFEGSWYRAICAGSEGTNFKVFFVDFGNFCEVKASSIRKMAKKFMKAPALAMNCTINGQERLKSNSELTKKICRILLEKVNTYIENVEVLKFKENTFLLKIPEIEAILFG